MSPKNRNIEKQRDAIDDLERYRVRTDDGGEVPLRQVAEVTFGQLEGGRFRHGVGFVRWRPDRSPESCRFDQLDVARPVRFSALFDQL